MPPYITTGQECTLCAEKGVDYISSFLSKVCVQSLHTNSSLYYYWFSIQVSCIYVICMLVVSCVRCGLYDLRAKSYVILSLIVCGMHVICMFPCDIHMQWSSSDAPQRFPYHSWYIVLSSLLHMAGRLHHHIAHKCDSYIRNCLWSMLLLFLVRSGVNCLATPLERCSKLVDRLQSDIVGYHIELCNNGLLHDGRSHHWQDSRPFHEVCFRPPEHFNL